MSDIVAATKRDIRDLIQSDSVRSQVALALPRYITPDRMLRVCLTSINRNPKLLECTPESLLGSIMQSAQMGIECDGRHGHLIPRWNGKKQCNEATFQPDYKGIVALVRRNPEVEDIYAEVVRENDQFSVTQGLHRDLVHEIDIRSERGEIIGAYAVIVYRGGAKPGFDFMSRRDIEGVRERSESWKSHVSKGYDTPWKTDEGEMFKKTVLKRLMKLADLSPETHERMSVDTEIPINDRVTEIPRAQIAGAKQAQLENGSAAGELVNPATAQAEVDAPSAEPPPVPEKTANATVIESGKPTPRAGKKLPAKKPAVKEPEPFTPEAKPADDADTRPQLTMLLFKLAGAGYKPEQLFEIAQENNWTEDTWKSLGDMPEEKLEPFNDDYDTVTELLEQKFGKGESAK